MSQEYAALIIDLRNSRSYTDSDRFLIQTHMIRILDFLNKAFSGDILRTVEFSAGDEIQGLFSTGESAYLLYRFFSIWLYPVKIRAGIGIGNWNLQMKGRGTTSQDGEVYHNARNAIRCTDPALGYPVLMYSASRNDRTLNTLMGGAANVTENLSITQNQLFLITEILFPLCLKNDFQWPYDSLAFNRLLIEKSCFDHKISKTDRELPLDHINLTDDSVGQIPARARNDIYRNTEPNAFFVTGGKQRGIPTEAAKILSIKRQTIARSLESGNIYWARSMALTVLYEMNTNMKEV